jgi:hypothetical protein
VQSHVPYLVPTCKEHVPHVFIPCLMERTILKFIHDHMVMMDELQNQTILSIQPIDNVHHAQHMTLLQHKHYFNKCWFHIRGGVLYGTFPTHNLKNCPDNCWHMLLFSITTRILNLKPLQGSRVIFLWLLKRLKTPPRVKSQFSCGFLKDFEHLQESRVIFLWLLKGLWTPPRVKSHFLVAS